MRNLELIISLFIIVSGGVIAASDNARINEVNNDFQAKSGNLIFANSASLYVEDPKSKGSYGGILQQKSTSSLNDTVQYDTRPMKTDLKGIGLRAIYVVTVVSGVVVAYLIIRAICSRRRKNRTRRYGMLSNESRDNMEMRPLSEHEDDDDDDMTLFDMTNRKGKR